MNFMIKRILDKHAIIVFITLSYAISWLSWWIASSSGSSAGFLEWIGDFGPFISAMTIASISEGRGGVRRLLNQFLTWRVNIIWYLFAIGLPIIGTVAIILLIAPAADVFSKLSYISNWLIKLGNVSTILLITILLGVAIVAGEEFGWRGYLLPKIQERHSNLVASTVVGIIWGVWHLPMLWPFEANKAAIDLIIFLSDILVISIIYTWLYESSKGSLLIICIFHSTYDVLVTYSSATLPFLKNHKGIELFVLIFISILVILFNRKIFSRKPEIILQ